jgi:endoglucanase
MTVELLKELCETPGIPGREERLRAIVRRELTGIVDEMRVDALGNLIAVRRKPGAPKVMLAAHMDEIGFVVSYIDKEKGWLRLVPLGGHDPRNMISQHVLVSTANGDLPGVLFPGLNEEERKKQPTVADFFVDLGLPGAAVREKVSIGDPVTLLHEFMPIGDCYSSKALDDRLSIYIMIEALRRTAQSGFEVYAVATVQEEIGLRGALTSGFGIHPDIGIALDTTLAVDIPGVPEHEHVTKLGAGTAIKILDSSAIAHPKLTAYLRSLAGARGIKWQHEILPRGGTDAGSMQKVHAGVAVATISTPSRYVHSSVEMVHKDDVEAGIALLAAFLAEGHTADLALE